MVADDVLVRRVPGLSHRSERCNLADLRVNQMKPRRHLLS